MKEMEAWDVTTIINDATAYSCNAHAEADKKSNGWAEAEKSFL